MQPPRCAAAYSLDRDLSLESTNSQKIGSKYLHTNRYGCFAMLTGEEHCQFLQNRMPQKLAARLEASGILITARNQGRLIETEARKYETIFRGTGLHIMVPTLRCNQRCIYCHAASRPQDASGYDMSEETAKKTVDLIFQSPSPAINIEFQGGEPLLNFEIVKYVITYAKRQNAKHKKSLHLSLVSNLTLMNDEILDYLIREKVGICTSLDGPKDVHDTNRKFLDGRGSHADVAKWARIINERSPGLLNSLTAVSRSSLSHPERIVDELEDLGFQKILIKPINYLGYAIDTWEKIGYSPEDYSRFYTKMIDHIVQQDKKIREVFTTFILMKILAKTEPNFLDLQNPCGAAIGQLAYDYDGSIYSCDEGRMIPGGVFRLGNITQTHRELMTSKETTSLVQASITESHLCDACAFKPYCGLCPVCSYASQGTLITKLPMDARCKILKEIFTYVFDRLESSEKHRQVFEGWVELVMRHA